MKNLRLSHPQGTISDVKYEKSEYLFIETYLYRVDIISSQAIFHMCLVESLLYNTGERYNTDKNVSRFEHII